MLKHRKKPTAHRQGTVIRLVAASQRFTEIQHADDFWLFDKDERFDEGKMNPKYVDEIQDLMKELRQFDIIEYGNLYLTSGGRIVLDKGYGEYFGDSDKVIYTLDELTRGIPAKQFLKKISEYVKRNKNAD